jgi:uncharacterized membrane protein
MTKHEFLNSLKSELETNQIKNVSEILADYEEHFTHGQSKGKSENDIAAALGSPSTIAKAYKTENMIQEIKRPENDFSFKLALNIIIRLLVLAPFNFIVLFIPGILTFAFLTAGWSASVAIVSAGFGALWYLPSLFSISSTFWLGLAGVFTFTGLASLGTIGLMIMFVITKYIVLGLISYLQWNLKFVMEK